MTIFVLCKGLSFVKARGMAGLGNEENLILFYFGGCTYSGRYSNTTGDSFLIFTVTSNHLLCIICFMSKPCPLVALTGTTVISSPVFVTLSGVYFDRDAVL